MQDPDRTKDTIRVLRDQPDEAWRVSLLLPTHRAGSQTQQDAIRLKNLLREADRQLQALPRMPGVDREQLLAPARALLDDTDYWNHQQGGLALYLDRTGMHEIKVPDSIAERCVVSESFHVKPLLPRLRGDGRYHILALSRNLVRLLRCTRDTMLVLPLGAIPESLEHALGFEKEQGSLAGRVAHRQGGGAGVVTPHGHGEGNDDRAAELESFLHKVDAAVHDRLAGEPGPLVLAGVVEVVSAFRKISRMAERIAEPYVEGSPDEIDGLALHDRSWPIVEQTFDDEFERARAHFERFAKTPRALLDVEQILAATAEGRVHTLLVALDAERWGRMHLGAHTIDIHEGQEPGDEELVDRAAVLGQRRGAEVIFAVTQDMPAGAPLAAVLHA